MQTVKIQISVLRHLFQVLLLISILIQLIEAIRKMAENIIFRKKTPILLNNFEYLFDTKLFDKQ